MNTGKALRYESKEALLAAHPRAPWHCYGPVHRHGEAYYIQTYLGQHKWLAINVEDTSDVRSDPGWAGTVYGYAFVEESDITAALRWEKNCQPMLEIDPPEREGKPITGDAWLQGDKAKVIEYLGPDDPISRSLAGGIDAK